MIPTRGIQGILVGTLSILVLGGCGRGLLAQPTPTPPSLDQLIAIVEASNPELPHWEYADFHFAVTELAKMGPAAAPAAPALARALQYRRRDSYAAGDALVAIGPAGKEAIPELIEALKNDRSVVRAVALYVLGVIGEPARCAVPEIAPLLWDAVSGVRITAARALDAITRRDLVEWPYKIDPTRIQLTGSLYEEIGRIDETPYDDSDLISKARTWWIEEGQYLDWGRESNWCNPRSP